MKKILLSVLLATMVAGCATDGNTVPDARPETVEMLVRQGGEVRFLGRAHGMDGWLVKLGDRVRAMYVAPDGEGVVVGLLHDENGENLTVRQIEALAQASREVPESEKDIKTAVPAKVEAVTEDKVAPALPPSAEDVAELAWKAAAQLTYVSIGVEDAPVVYVMFDPRCSYCSLYLSDLLEGPISKGELTVRLLPVSVLGEASVRMAAAMLSANVPAEAILRHAIGRNMELPTPTEENLTAVRNNSLVLESLGLRSTPRTIYKTAAGEYGVVSGAPRDLAAFVEFVRQP